MAMVDGASISHQPSAISHDYQRVCIDTPRMRP